MLFAAPVLLELSPPKTNGCIQHEEVVGLGLEVMHVVYLREEGQQLRRGSIESPTLSGDMRVKLHGAEEPCSDPSALHRLMGVEVQATHRVHLVGLVLAVEHKEMLDASLQDPEALVLIDS